jgi:hypothetical protein
MVQAVSPGVRAMRPGDYITGIDRSYPRSIYQVVSVFRERIIAQWVALQGVVYSPDWGIEQTSFIIDPSLFRVATISEIAEAKRAICECGAESLGHPGHSDWCKLSKN